MSDKESKSTEIVPAPVRPLVSPEQAAQDWQLFQELKKQLLNSDDYQPIAGKPFPKKSAFRKLAVYFGLSDRIIEQERKDREDGSFLWRIVVEAEAPNGRVSTGVGVCDSNERQFAHVEHDVYSTAHTRAKNRAISDMVAGGIVSAEELSDRSLNLGTSLSAQISAVGEALEKAGLEVAVFSMYPDKDKLILDPKKNLGDAFDKYKNVLFPLGFKWSKGRFERKLEVK